MRLLILTAFVIVITVAFTLFVPIIPEQSYYCTAIPHTSFISVSYFLTQYHPVGKVFVHYPIFGGYLFLAKNYYFSPFSHEPFCF